MNVITPSPPAFLTKEQMHARDSGSLEAYWHLQDPLCAKFLNLGRTPAQFPAVKAFFPFIRAASIMQQTPKSFKYIQYWACLAFYAGVLYGEQWPLTAEQILEDNPHDCADALKWVGFLRNSVGRRQPTPWDFYEAFEQACKVNFKEVSVENLTNCLVSSSLGSFKTGLATATAAKNDPFLDLRFEAGQRKSKPGQESGCGSS